MSSIYRSAGRLLLPTVLGLLTLATLAGCRPSHPAPTPQPVLLPVAPPALPWGLDESRVLSLGTIDSSEPRKPIERFQPLADYLAANGYLLPVGFLVKQGMTVREMSGPRAAVQPDEAGYYFTGDQENSVELVLRGLVTGAGISNQEYDKLAPELKKELVAVGQSITVPRSLVSATPRLGRVVLERASVLLVRMDDTAERRELLKKTDKFEALTPENLSSVAGLRQLMLLVR